MPPGPPWTDLTNQTVDPDNNIICGDTDTLSVFAIQLPAPAVGGIAEVVVGGGEAPASTGAGSGSSSLLYAAIVGGAAAVMLAAGGWYARRRWLR